MAKTQLCIVLGIGLLALGLGPRTASSGEVVATWGPTSPDTSGVFVPNAQGAGHSLWSRRDTRPWWRGRARSGQNRLSGLQEAGAQRAGTAITGEPVANPNLWGANGNVVGIARSGNTLYIAGSFRSVGENSGGFVPIDARTGTALKPFPKVAGSVYAIVPDGLGGWYIGGDFTAVGGKPRSCLAQICPDGSVSEWNPSVTGSPGYIDPPAVSAIKVVGDRVFVGGGFREIGGLPHENLGCVEAGTGAVLGWNLDTNVDGWVFTFAAHEDTVFVGGGFSSVGGQARSSLAAVNAASGEVLPWRVDVFGGAYALLARGDTLYVGGDFIGIAGQARGILAAVDIRSAQLLPFDARASGINLDYVPQPQVAALALVGDTLYAVGNFTQIGGQARASLAMLNPTTGDALAWSAPFPGPQWEGFPPRLCTAIAVSGGAVYVGGWFETLGAENRPFAAAVSMATGALTGWNPKPDLAVAALVAKGDTVYMGGIFSLVGEWQHRAGLAAIDLTTGTVKPWNPNPDGSICTAITVSGDRVFVSGDFANIGGAPQPRRGFAALDTLNGEATGWNPGANSVGTVFLLEGDTLYVGGEFSEVGGQPRNYLVALSASTGEILPWDPNANSPVYAMARSGNTIYVGGIFQRMGGQWRRGIAAVDAATGALNPWNPDTDNSVVDALLADGNTVYVGGGFNLIGGQPRTGLAALDGATGEATPWNPQLTAWGAPIRVRALALHEGGLYVGGRFGGIGGQPRICLATVDTSTGLATDWDPGTDGLVWSLAAYGNTLYAGGGFTRAGGLPAAGLAAFSIPEERVPVPTVPFGLAQSIPNPARSSAIIRFSLPQAAPVTLSVFDVQGRRVASLLDHALQAAGRHDVPLQSDGWKPGVYLYRLEAGGHSATRKLIVLE